MQRRLHEVWAEASTQTSAREFIPVLAAVGSAVEDLQVAAEDVGSAAQKLDAERLRYEELFHLAPNGYLVTDSQTIIVEANEAAGALLGRASRCLIGENLSSFIAIGQRHLIADLETHCRAEANRSLNADDVQLIRVREPLRVGIHCRAARDVEGGVIGYRWILHDLTDRLHAQALAREMECRETGRLRDLAEHWRQLDGAKSHFLNLASHELRTPLTVLGGYLAMLEAGTFGELTAPVDSVIALLAAKTQEMNALVNEMLEAARLDEGALALEFTRVNLTDLVQQVVLDCRQVARPGQRVILIGPRDAVVVDADPVRLRTVIVNLVSNAIKYSPDGTEIVCTVLRNRNTARITVRDQGIGISEADRASLFSRFGRVVTPATSGIPGTGIGLYMARELARMHGGEVTVRSALGQGSTFVVSLPLNTRAVEVPRPTS
jgi:PAS domain S-box-containing protein